MGETHYIAGQTAEAFEGERLGLLERIADPISQRRLAAFGIQLLVVRGERERFQSNWGQILNCDFRTVLRPSRDQRKKLFIQDLTL